MATDLAKEIYRLSSTGTHKENPYHNPTHCWQVFSRCCEIMNHEQKEMTVSLTWASLFHDYNHSGGKHLDSHNIERALDGLWRNYRGWCVDNCKEDSDFFNAGHDYAVISELIRVTEYTDGVFVREPYTFEQMAIRDADLMTVFLPLEEAAEQTLGLYTEICVGKPTLTRAEFWELNVEFLKNAVWYTSYGKVLAERWLDEKLASLKPLVVEEPETIQVVLNPTNTVA